MQYTIRQVPKQVDNAARAKATAEGKSLNQILVEAIQAGLGVSEERDAKRDLSFMTPDLESARDVEQAHDWFDRVWQEERSE